MEAATKAEVLFDFSFAVENMKTDLIINKKDAGFAAASFSVSLIFKQTAAVTRKDQAIFSTCI
jgi:hypothetical protein